MYVFLLPTSNELFFWHYLEIENEIPRVKGSFPEDNPPSKLQMPVTNADCHSFWLTGCTLVDPFFEFNLLELLTELNINILQDYQLLQKVTTQEHQME